MAPDPDKWLPGLPHEDQVRILGFWEVTRRFSVDTGPLAGCTLTQLIRIVETTEELWRALGYSNARKAQGALGRLPTFRNKVMHPVRPLILTQEDVGEVKRTVERLIELGKHLGGWLDADAV